MLGILRQVGIFIDIVIERQLGLQAVFYGELELVTSGTNGAATQKALKLPLTLLLPLKTTGSPGGFLRRAGARNPGSYTSWSS